MTEKQFRIEQLKELARQQKLLEQERKELTKAHREYLKRDIVEIYSAMAVVLHNNGNSDDEIADLIQQIQAEWTYHVTERSKQTQKTMREYCIELTGIDLEETVE